MNKWKRYVISINKNKITQTKSVFFTNKNYLLPQQLTPFYLHRYFCFSGYEQICTISSRTKQCNKWLPLIKNKRKKKQLVGLFLTNKDQLPPQR